MTVWDRRDMPLLQALSTSDDDNLRRGFLMIGEPDTRTLGLELTRGEVHDGMLALRDAGYVDFEVQYETGPGAMFTHLLVTGRGRQALGEWPLFDEIASPETLALLLERLADEASSDEEASNLRRAARYARSLGGASLRAAAIGVTSQLAKIALGLG